MVCADTQSFPVAVDINNETFKVTLPDGAYNYNCGGVNSYSFQSSVQTNLTDGNCTMNLTQIYNYTTTIDYDLLADMWENSTCPELDISPIGKRVADAESAIIASVTNECIPKQEEFNQLRMDKDNATTYYNEEVSKNNLCKAQLNYSGTLLTKANKDIDERTSIIYVELGAFLALLILSGYGLAQKIVGGGFKFTPKPKEEVK